jgi:glycosyltransferase involved in cell wall biosynthesis
MSGMKAVLSLLCNELNIPHVITAHHAGIACPSGALMRKDDSICTVVANPDDCVPCCSYLRRPKWYTGGMIGKIPVRLYRPIGERLNSAGRLNYIGRGLIHPWLVERSLDAERIVLDSAQLIISPSRFIRDLLVRNGCASSRIIVIPHGVDLIGGLPFDAFAGRPVRFGYIGRINFHKGLHVILQALERLEKEEQCELHIYGEAQHPWEVKYLKRQLENYKGSAGVIAHGNLPPEKIKEAFRNIDVLIVPSLVPEAFGLVVQEAFSAGRPVIVSNSGALPELVKGGIDGFIVERKNDKLLASAMHRMIADPSMIIEMSSRLPRVKTTPEYVDEMEGIYKGVILAGDHSLSAHSFS